jgi:plastocyanin
MPKTLTVQAGTPVVWLQTGVGTHTVTADDGSFDSHPNCPDNTDTCMKQGETFVFTFDKAGHHAFHCKVHQPLGMTGEIVVL